MKTAGNQVLSICGQVSLTLNQKKASDVFYIPIVKRNLLSVGRLTDMGHIAFFNSKDCYVYDKGDSHRVLLQDERDPLNNLYKLSKPATLPQLTMSPPSLFFGHPLLGISKVLFQTSRHAP